jgi:hypothetical protein
MHAAAIRKQKPKDHAHTNPDQDNIDSAEMVFNSQMDQDIGENPDKKAAMKQKMVQD